MHSRNGWLVVGLAALAVFMATLDASIVTIALPTITDEFHAEPSASQWAILGYVLALACLVLPIGRWLDGVGKRAALLTGVVGFALASVLVAMAPNLEWLVVARIAQGAFGALLFALVPALATLAVPPDRRGRAMSLIGTVGPLGAVAGPAIGGLLVSRFGWPSIFLVNVPICVVVVALIFLTMYPDGGLRLPPRSWFVEAALLATGIGAVMVSLTFAPTGGPAWLLLIPAAFLPLAAWRRLDSSQAIRNLLGEREFRRSAVALTFIVTSTALIQFASPFFMERVLDLPVETASLVLLAFPAAMAVCGPFAGAIADRAGVRRVATIGAVFVPAGVFLASPLATDWTAFDLAWRLAVVGVGMGLFVGPNQAAMMSAAPRELLASAGAVGGLARSIGFAMGPALATAVWSLASYDPAGLRMAAVLAGVLAVAAMLGIAPWGRALAGPSLHRRPGLPGAPAAAAASRRPSG
jgi:DHA2 family multidrug resistance protein-like MFS transporter